MIADITLLKAASLFPRAPLLLERDLHIYCETAPEGVDIVMCLTFRPQKSGLRVEARFPENLAPNRALSMILKKPEKVTLRANACCPSALPVLRLSALDIDVILPFTLNKLLRLPTMDLQTLSSFCAGAREIAQKEAVPDPEAPESHWPQLLPSIVFADGNYLLWVDSSTVPPCVIEIKPSHSLYIRALARRPYTLHHDILEWVSWLLSKSMHVPADALEQLQLKT